MAIDSAALKEKMERSSRIAIVIPPDASEETYLAAVALAEKANGKAFVAGGNTATKQRWQALFGYHEEPKKEFTIVINTAEHPIESLKYETRDNQLKIFLSMPAYPADLPAQTGQAGLPSPGFERASPQSRILPEHVRFEEAYPRSSLVIAIGFSSHGEEEETLRDFPLEEGGETLSLATAPEKMALSPLKLFARIILRARAERGAATLWSFIGREDFVKTDTTSPSIPPLLSLWRKLMPQSRFTVFLWQEKETEQISGLIHSYDELALERVAAALGTRPASDYFVIPPMFNNFTEAEFKIRRLLKEVAP